MQRDNAKKTPWKNKYEEGVERKKHLANMRAQWNIHVQNKHVLKSNFSIFKNVFVSVKIMPSGLA